MVLSKKVCEIAKTDDAVRLFFESFFMLNDDIWIMTMLPGRNRVTVRLVFAVMKDFDWGS